MAKPRRRIAVACQGGGSHTAFTAGALKRLLRQDTYEVVALSGTSGGAIDALLGWYGLISGEAPGDHLDAFWQDMAANEPFDLLMNDLALWSYRALAPVINPEVSPYLYPPWAAQRLRQAVEAHVDFARIPGLVADRGPATPLLMVGAVDVLSGRFEVFRNQWDAGTGAATLEVTADAILASAAIPTLFRAAHVAGGVYWDGLFSQNPPVRDLPDANPDEIWVVQINPTSCPEEPTSMADIRDRRNELAGNLSLHQELDFIRKINALIAGDGKGNKLTGDTTYRPIEIRILEMDAGCPLDSESKLNRDPRFIRSLMERGEAQAEAFLRAPVGAR